MHATKINILYIINIKPELILIFAKFIQIVIKKQTTEISRFSLGTLLEQFHEFSIVMSSIEIKLGIGSKP